MSKGRRTKRPGNPVAKNLEKFNRPVTHVDQKKEEKRGKQKHKGNDHEQATV
jgi:hypothetical protein